MTELQEALQKNAGAPLSDKLRRLRFRRTRERYRLREEIRLIPRKVYLILGILFLVAHIISQTILYFGDDRPLRDPSPLWNGLALAGMVTAGSILIAMLAFLVAYVHQDAQRRGMNPTLWTMLVLIMLPAYLVFGFILYFLLREPLPYACPSCAQVVSARYNYCPACKCNLRPSCPSCRQEVAGTDRYCPNCAQELAGPIAGQQNPT